MKDFCMEALPWIVMGVVVAMICTHISKQKNYKNQEEESKEKIDGENYMIEGMGLGTCAGVFVASLGVLDYNMAISFGMLFGLGVGSFIKK